MPGGHALAPGRTRWRRAIRILVAALASACELTSRRGPGNRREGHRRQQLRVVAQTLLRIGAGPGEIENELAARNAICGTAASRPPESPAESSTTRCLGSQPVRGAAHPDSSSASRNSCRRNGCARAGQRIPTLRIDLRNAVEESRRPKRHAWAARGSAWVSASIRSRYLSASSAAMQPVPAEVTA